MIKELQYTGYTAQPSDYEAPDGTLAQSFNLINEDGALKPIPTPKVVNASLPVGAKVFKHLDSFLIYDSQTSSLSFRRGDFAVPTKPEIATVKGVISFASVSNIVTVSTSDGLHYVRWMPNEKRYLYLGTALPDLDIQLSLLTSTASKAYHPGVSFISGNTAYSEPQSEVLYTAPETDYPLEALFAERPNRSASLSGGGTIGGGTIPDEPVQLTSLHKTTNKIAITHDFSVGRYTLSLTSLSIIEDDIFIAISNGAGKIIKKALRDVSTLRIAVIPFDIESATSSISVSIDFHATSATKVSFAMTMLKVTQTAKQQTIPRPDYTAANVEKIAGAVNSFIAEECTNKDLFIYPFFACYALRMFDGSHVHISAPCLLAPTTGYAPLIHFRDSSTEQLLLRAAVSQIRYTVKSSPEIDNWKDLITAVDFFVSPQLWPYQQSAEYSEDHPELFRFQYLSSTQRYSGYADFALKYAERTDLEKHQNQLDVSTFYHVASVPFDKIVEGKGATTTLNMDKSALSNLRTRTTLDLLAVSHSGFAGGSLHVYNNRLHVYNASTMPATPVPYSRTQGYSTPVARLSRILVVKVFIRTQHGDKVVVSRYPGEHLPDTLHWYYYPDSRAYKVEFTSYAYHDQIGFYHASTFALSLNVHPFLSGAYYLSYNLSLNPENITSIIAADPPEALTPDVIPAPSALYLSDANNPFRFSAESVVSIPDSNLLAISSAAKALSQGQFGQFPLYAFTDNGVWAMSVSTTGTYSARQPITRDVCLSPDSIVQIDSAVLFASRRGIMLLSGSNVECISDVINTPNDALFLLPHFGKHSDAPSNIIAFERFIQNARMAYCYTTQRIILYNPSLQYAYVFSLKSKLWGMMHSNLIGNVNTYPESLCIASDGSVVDLALHDEGATGVTLVTRPLKLDTPNILKTIDTVISRGNFRNGHLQTILYGSRDLSNWHVVWSSTNHELRGFSGTPYKWFRIALMGNLESGESIFGSSIQFNPKYNDKLR